MVETFTSTQLAPRQRGEEFGAAFCLKIKENIEIYRRLFLSFGRRSEDEIRAAATSAFSLVQSHLPSLAEEIAGMADGAGVPLADLMALNARTELLAACGQTQPSECSVVIALNSSGDSASPIALQTWDWLSELSESWLLWTIPSADGHVVHTLTEYGILGKIGMSTAGVGVLLNILSHQQDGQLPPGLPVHIIARAILDERANLNAVVAKVAAVPMTASSCVSVMAKSGPDATAFCFELFPTGPSFCMPDERGLLVHTNHFLSPLAAPGDRAPKFGSSSFSRYEQLRRKLHGKQQLDAEEILQSLCSHVGGTHAICSHPLQGAGFGQRSETLAVVQMDLAAGEMRVRKGSPCSNTPWVTLS